MPAVSGTLVFNQNVKHGKYSFIPNKVNYGFEDPDAVTYFKATRWASDAPSGEEPDFVISLAELDIDPETVFATGPNRGEKVLSGAKAGDGTIQPHNGKLGAK